MIFLRRIVSATLGSLGAFFLFVGVYSLLIYFSVLSLPGINMVVSSFTVMFFLTLAGAVLTYVASSLWEHGSSVVLAVLIILISLDVAMSLTREEFLGGTYTLKVGGVQVAKNVPFGLWFNDVAVGPTPAVTLDADMRLSLAGLGSSAPGTVTWAGAIESRGKTVSGWSDMWLQYSTFNTVSNVSWKQSGSKLSAKVVGVALGTISANSPIFAESCDNKVLFRVRFFASVTVAGSTVRSEEKTSKSFMLRFVRGELVITDITPYVQ